MIFYCDEKLKTSEIIFGKKLFELRFVFNLAQVLPDAAEKEIYYLAYSEVPHQNMVQAPLTLAMSLTLCSRVSHP